jgi:carbamoyl-phosphate synthase large subunit
VDVILGPEMKSTGEVMGVGDTFAEAFVKSQLAASVKMPHDGKVFISVRDEDKNGVVEVARTLNKLGFIILATRGTGSAIRSGGVDVTVVNKVAEGRPHIVDMIKNGEIKLIINTVDSRPSVMRDSYSIRHAALQGRVTYYTTLSGARAACVGMQYLAELQVYDVQSMHRRLA